MSAQLTSMRYRFNQIGFKWLHQNHLVYSTCWEDPQLDRVALNLTEKGTLLAITSAGCNVLDYALDRPRHIYAIDMNPRQNALLELKIAGIRALEFSEFFQLFGQGYLPNFSVFYQKELRPQLSSWSRSYWDRNGERFFCSDYSLFFRGTTGIVARALNFYIDHVAKVREAICSLINSESLDEQQEIYDRDLHAAFWRDNLRCFINHDIFLWFLGVPYQQRQQLECYYHQGVAGFVEQCCKTVFRELPIQNNYFWRVFLEGQYSRSCCPTYLEYGNFQALKNGLVDRISVHTNTVTGFLQECDDSISHFVLLDHMDWLSQCSPIALEQEWKAIVEHTHQRSRVLFRSGGMEVDYIDQIPIQLKGHRCQLQDLLTYNRTLAQALHIQDRVHTYGSFYIADLLID